MRIPEEAKPNQNFGNAEESTGKRVDRTGKSCALAESAKHNQVVLCLHISDPTGSGTTELDVRFIQNDEHW